LQRNAALCSAAKRVLQTKPNLKSSGPILIAEPLGAI
jgi:hypothetical protein